MLTPAHTRPPLPALRLSFLILLARRMFACFDYEDDFDYFVFHVSSFKPIVFFASLHRFRTHLHTTLFVLDAVPLMIPFFYLSIDLAYSYSIFFKSLPFLSISLIYVEHKRASTE